MNQTDPMHLEKLLFNWQDDVVEWLRHAGPRVLVILLLAFILVRLLRGVSRRLVRFSETKTNGGRAHQMHQLRTLAAVINSVGTVVILFFAAMEVLPVFGIDMKPLLASAGIAGLAIGFGAQALVKDVINGFFILVEDQYHLGDTIRTAGVQGSVEDMTLRLTVLRDSNGALHFVPNGEIKLISNLTRDWTLLGLKVAVDYNENSERVTAALREAGDALKSDPTVADLILNEPHVAGIERILGGEAEYLTQVRTRPGKQAEVARALRQAIKDSFERHGIKTASAARVVVVGGTGSPDENAGA
jgi:moderate conductance mechanosensitive channel